jgi:hypothetical protein
MLGDLDRTWNGKRGNPKGEVNYLGASGQLAGNTGS